MEKIYRNKKELLKYSLPKIDYYGGRQEKNIKRDYDIPFDMLIPNIPSTEKIRNDLINLFKNSNKHNYWKSLDEVSKETGYSVGEIEKTVSPNDFLGQLKDEKFTSRKAYNIHTPFWKQIVDLMKNNYN